ncbi:hypothetical protein [Calothrix rhizosoleniae]|nr:hypothetical protein [Calothrix rhizosoleniae]
MPQPVGVTRVVASGATRIEAGGVKQLVQVQKLSNLFFGVP